MKTLDTASSFRFETEHTEQGDQYFRLTVRDPSNCGYYFVEETVAKVVCDQRDPEEMRREILEACRLKAFIHFVKTYGPQLISTCDDCGSLSFISVTTDHVCVTPNEETKEADPPSAKTK